MRKTDLVLGALFMVLPVGCVSAVSQQEDTLASLHPPVMGGEPVPFAPGLVSTPQNREIEGMFGADMNSVYFIRRPWGAEETSNSLILLEFGQSGWQEEILRQDVSEPSISPDGARIYFKTEYIEKTDDGWSDLKGLGAPFDAIDIMRLSAAANGNLYFDTFTPELDTPLRVARYTDGQYQPPVSLGPQFGVGIYNAHPFISPDESYIVWDSRREGGYGGSDLYMSFRSPEGVWGPAINLGDKINTSADENYPSISPDGKYLIFDQRGDLRADGERTVKIFWVDVQTLLTRQSPQ